MVDLYLPYAMIQSSTNQLCNNKLSIELVLCFGIHYSDSRSCNNDPILIRISLAIYLYLNLYKLYNIYFHFLKFL